VTRFAAQPARDAVARYATRRQPPITEVATALGLDRSTLLRLHTRDWLRYDAADHIAIALGQHPSELWPDWFTPATAAQLAPSAASLRDDTGSAAPSTAHAA